MDPTNKGKKNPSPFLNVSPSPFLNVSPFRKKIIKLKKMNKNNNISYI